MQLQTRTFFLKAAFLILQVYLINNIVITTTKSLPNGYLILNRNSLHRATQNTTPEMNGIIVLYRNIEYNIEYSTSLQLDSISVVFFILGFFFVNLGV